MFHVEHCACPDFMGESKERRELSLLTMFHVEHCGFCGMSFTKNERRGFALRTCLMKTKRLMFHVEHQPICAPFAIFIRTSISLSPSRTLIDALLPHFLRASIFSSNNDIASHKLMLWLFFELFSAF